MTEYEASVAPSDSDRRLGTFGAILAAAGALGLIVIRLVASDSADLGGVVDQLGFTMLYAVPFILSLLAAALPTTARAGAWLGAGIVGILLSFSAFSLVTLILLPGSVVLVKAGASAMGRGAAWSIGLMVAFVAAAAVSFAGLFLVFPDEQVCVHRRTLNSEFSSCTSDVVTGEETLTAAAPWALVAAGMLIVARREI